MRNNNRKSLQVISITHIVGCPNFHTNTLLCAASSSDDVGGGGRRAYASSRGASAFLGGGADVPSCAFDGSEWRRGRMLRSTLVPRSEHARTVLTISEWAGFKNNT